MIFDIKLFFWWDFQGLENSLKIEGVGKKKEDFLWVFLFVFVVFVVSFFCLRRGDKKNGSV